MFQNKKRKRKGIKEKTDLVSVFSGLKKVVFKNAPRKEKIKKTTKKIIKKQETRKILKKTENKFSKQTVVSDQSLDLFDNIKNAVVVYEPRKNGKEFYLKDFNRQAERIEGILKGDVVGKEIRKVFPKVIEFGILALLKESYETGEPQYMPQGKYVDRNGRVSFRENYIYKAPTGDIVSVYDDITEKIYTKEKVREKEEKYSYLFNSIKDGIVRVDMKGVVVDCNHAFLDMLGYSRVEVFKLSYLDITPQKWHAKEAEILKNQILPRGFSDPYEKEYKRKNGTIFPVSLRTWIIKDQKTGVPTGMWAIIRDITEKKKNETELEKNEEKLEEIFDNSPIGIELYDEKGVLNKVNEKILNIFGVSGEEAVEGFNLFDDPNIPKEQIKLIKKGVAVKYENVFDFEKVKKFRLYKTKKTGKIYVSVSITPLQKGRAGYLVMIEDITEDKNSQIQLKEKMEQMEEMNRLMIGRELKMIKLKQEISLIKKDKNR